MIATLMIQNFRVILWVGDFEDDLLYFIVCRGIIQWSKHLTSQSHCRTPNQLSLAPWPPMQSLRGQGSGRSKKPAKAKAKASQAKLSSGCLTKLLKVYKGLEDFHLPLFKEVQRIAKAKRVLYPGSHWHLQASVVFPDVTYVDYNQKVAPFFEDPAVLAWIKQNKLYAAEAKMKFCLNDFEHLKLPGGFDLLISMSAGIVF